MKPFYQFILYWCSCGTQLVLGTLGFLEVIRYTQKLNPSLDLLCHHVTLSICIIKKPSLSLICTAKNWREKYLHVVSARLVEAKNINWCLFRVSDQRFIKRFGKSCHIFELGSYLNCAMLTSLQTSIVYIQHLINSPLSWKLHFLPFNYCKTHKYMYAMSGGHFQSLRKLPRCTFGGFSKLQR